MIKLKGVFGVWWGGSSFGESSPAQHLEAFDSYGQAQETLRDRLFGGMTMREFRYLLVPEVSTAVPGVDESSMIELFDVWIDAGDVRYEAHGVRSWWRRPDRGLLTWATRSPR